MSQLALAWLLKQGNDIFPLLATTRLYLEENWAGLDILLTGDEETELKGIVHQSQTAGGIVPPQFVPMLYRDDKEKRMCYRGYKAEFTFHGNSHANCTVLRVHILIAADCF